MTTKGDSQKRQLTVEKLETKNARFQDPDEHVVPYMYPQPKGRFSVSVIHDPLSNFGGRRSYAEATRNSFSIHPK